jgi:hypothetical protein
MYSMHWPRFHYDEAEKAERPIVPIDKEGRELRVIGTVITVLYVGIIMAAWTLMSL